MKKLFSTLLILATLFSNASWAEGTKTLLISDSKELMSEAKSYFSDVLNVMSSDVENNYISKQLITGEGSRISFDDLFHQKSFRDSSALQQLKDEYAPKTISLVWIESEDVKDYKAYGLKRSVLKLRLRVIDAISGRTITDKSISYKPRYKVEPKDEDDKLDARKATLAKALSEFDLDKVKNSISSYLDGSDSMSNKFRVVVNDVKQKDYFDWKNKMFDFMGPIGANNLRESYDKASKVLTVRGDTGSNVSDFFQSMYQKATDSKTFDGFDIDRSGNMIEFNKQQADKLTVVINNIAPSDYRSVGAAMDSIIKNLDVKELEKSYSREDFQLTYVFDTVDKAVDLDTELWKRISGNSSLEKIVQDSGAGNVLGYFFNNDRADSRHIEVTVRNVNEDDYSKAGRMLITTVKQIEGVDKFKYDYSEEDQVINMTFFYKGENAYAVDSVIWDRISNNRDLSGLKAGLIDENALEYLFSEKDDGKNSDRVLIVMKGVSGKDYKHVSTAFAKALRSARDVRHVRYGYSVKRQTITFRVKYSGDGMFALEDAIQLAMSKDDLLKDVERGQDKGGRLIYHFNSEDSDDSSSYSNDLSTSFSGSLIDKLDKQVVFISAYDGDKGSSGSGFFVSKNGYIMTNAHVVDGSDRLYVTTLDGDRIKAEIIDSNAKLDLALIKLVTVKKNFPANRIGNSNNLRKGQPIIMIGNPLGARYEHTVLTGIISGFNRHNGSIQLSIPSYPGSSGSPVFNSQGRVIGVMRARAVDSKTSTYKIKKEEVTFTSYEGVENIGLAVPINYAKPMLSMAK
ncbi:S1C family serine protease [Candidatus Thioglobus autotrophicus]|uniref:S1C family serine protease n=1 Tax=Candidatus Thioglobus autotrophicus TaxID=1705394 RepID=UPI0006B69FB8|nr:serine protease [Candidatus Thioglobus autotrophicus]